MEEPNFSDPEPISTPAELLQPGDYALVHPGAPFPADGTVVCGKGTTVRTILNGELSPEPTEPGSSVDAGCMNIEGPIIVEVLRTGEQTLLSQSFQALSKANDDSVTTEGLTDVYLA